jgi:DNA modification methylase
VNILGDEDIPLDALCPFPGNPNVMGPEERAQLRDSLLSFGVIAPLTVRRLPDGTQVLLGGFHRWDEAKKLRAEGKFGATISCRVVECDEKEAVKANVALNKIHGEFDLALLAASMDVLIDGVDEADIAAVLAGSGFDVGSLDALIKEVTPPPPLEDPGPGEPPAEPVTRPGDVWLMGEHRLVCGDSRTVEAYEVACPELVDLVCTDPPYGIAYESNYYKGDNPHGAIACDDVPPVETVPLWASVSAADNAVLCFTRWDVAADWLTAIAAHWTLKNYIVWVKNNWSMGDLTGRFASQHEDIIFGARGKVELREGRERDVWQCDREPPQDHPTTKPVELVARGMKALTGPKDRVLDPFLGSGTTLIAAEQLGRVCYGIEISEQYVDVAVRRWCKATGRKAINEATGVEWDGTPQI